MKKIKNKGNLIKLIILISLIISMVGCSTKKEMIETTKEITNPKKEKNNNKEKETHKELDKKQGNLTNQIKIHFMDVGQADAILIEQGENAMLVDAGNNADRDLVLKYLEKRDINKLNYIIGTHAHEDHIGALDDVIDNLEIEKVILPNKSATTQTYKRLLESIEKKNLKITKPNVGDKYKLGEAEFQILAPNSEKYKDLNDSSVVIKIVYKNNSFLLAGDAEIESEKDMIKSKLDLKAEILKLGHHGSKSSTSTEFLQEVDPSYAVLSCQRNNSYTLPDKETMFKLRNNAIKVYRTDEQGTIICTSDGENIKFNTSPGTYKSPDDKKTESKKKKTTTGVYMNNLNQKESNKLNEQSGINLRKEEKTPVSSNDNEKTGVTIKKDTNNSNSNTKNKTISTPKKTKTKRKTIKTRIKTRRR